MVVDKHLGHGFLNPIKLFSTLRDVVLHKVHYKVIVSVALRKLVLTQVLGDEYFHALLKLHDEELLADLYSFEDALQEDLASN